MLPDDANAVLDDVRDDLPVVLRRTVAHEGRETLGPLVRLPLDPIWRVGQYQVDRLLRNRRENIPSIAMPDRRELRLVDENGVRTNGADGRGESWRGESFGHHHHMHGAVIWVEPWRSGDGGSISHTVLSHVHVTEPTIDVRVENVPRLLIKADLLPGGCERVSSLSKKSQHAAGCHGRVGDRSLPTVDVPFDVAAHPASHRR